jgi:imipenem/basic amino acid-specific outer membrane pore
MFMHGTMRSSGIILCALMANIADVARADTLSSSSFFQDSTTQILSRNFYFNRDYRNAANSAQSARDEWAQGFIAKFSSGYTPGTIGVGVDAIGMLGLKLDSGSGSIGTGLLPSGGTHTPGEDSAADQYSKGGAAIKLRYSKTVFKYGEQQVNTPVFATGDVRLLPEVAEGLLVSSREIDGLLLEAGHFTSFTQVDRSARASGRLREADFAGFQYQLTPELSASVYSARLEDFWDKRYFGLTWAKPLDNVNKLQLDFRFYDQQSRGQALAGYLDNRSYSLKAALKHGAHTFTLANQQIHGDGAYTFYVDGGSADYMANYIQYSEFTKASERSWQARYDYDFSAWGVPGLTFSTRYVRGTNIDRGSLGHNESEWERNVDVGYTVQSGPLKKLSFKVRQATYRDSFDGDVDEVRVITEYPINL